MNKDYLLTYLHYCGSRRVADLQGSRRKAGSVEITSTRCSDWAECSRRCSSKWLRRQKTCPCSTENFDSYVGRCAGYYQLMRVAYKLGVKQHTAQHTTALPVGLERLNFLLLIIIR